MFVETDVNVTAEELKNETVGNGENSSRKFTDEEIKRIIEFNNVIKENTPLNKNIGAE